jgi:opacity protein-like surface antigen
MRKLVAGAALLLLLPITLFAQEYGPAKAELFTGVSYLRLEKTNQLGWDASVNGVLNRNLGIVADASGYYNSENHTINGIETKADRSIHSILVGPRVVDPRGRFSPFAQALFGWSRVSASGSAGTSSGVFLSTSDAVNAFGMRLGGGMDFLFNQQMALRIVQVDYMMLRSHGDKSQGVALGAGVVFRLGEKR